MSHSLRHGVSSGMRVLAMLLAATFVGASALADQSVGGTIRKMTGARTKIAWIRGSKGLGHPFGPIDEKQPPLWRIVVVDTDENGAAERILTPEFSTYSHVMITPSGRRVVWTIGAEKAKTGEVWICDWDGKGARKLLDAKLAVAVAEDPVGTEWVYVKDGENQDKITAVWRYRIDDTSKKELVWDKTNSNDKWEVSRDGKFGVSGLPWPHAGMANLPNGEFQLFGDGCTPGIAADGLHMTCMIAMGHRGVHMYDKDGANHREIDFTHLPGTEGIGGPQFWWCSFARYDGRFYTFSGPHPNMSYTPNGSNIYFCQFNEKWDALTKVVIVTDDPEMDTQAYAWIDSQKTPGSTDTIEVDATINAQMGAAAREPVVVTLTNHSDKAIKGTARLVLPAGWTSEPAKAAYAVAKGAQQQLTLQVAPPKDNVPTGKIRMLATVADENGQVFDTIRLALKVGAPVQAVALTPRTINEAAQPFDVLVRNVSDRPLSGTVKIELDGPAKFAPIEQKFGPIEGAKEALVEIVVPKVRLTGQSYLAKFSVCANGTVVPAQINLGADRWWQVLGPFQNPAGEGFNMMDYSSHNGKGLAYAFEPEAELPKGLDISKEYALPKDLQLSGTFGAVGSDFKVRWRTAPLMQTGFVDLSEIFTPFNETVAYAMTYVRSPKDTKALLSIGADDCMKAWVNGKLVVTDPKYHAASPGSSRTEIELKTGWNEIVLKIGQGFGGWGYFCEILTPDGKPSTDLKWSLVKD